MNLSILLNQIEQYFRIILIYIHLKNDEKGQQSSSMSE